MGSHAFYNNNFLTKVILNTVPETDVTTFTLKTCITALGANTSTGAIYYNPIWLVTIHVLADTQIEIQVHKSCIWQNCYVKP